MIRTIVHIIAKSPPAILLALGGVGVLLQFPNAGILLFIGVVLQLLWLGFKFGF